jgi:hypothetical protein
VISSLRQIIEFGVGGMALWEKWVGRQLDGYLWCIFWRKESGTRKDIACIAPAARYSCSACLEVMQFVYDYYRCEKCIGTEWTLLIKVHTVLYLSSESRN